MPPGAYHWRADGFVADRGVDIDLVIVDGVAESDGASGSGAEFAPNGLFSLMQDALNEGISVKGAFDDDMGSSWLLYGDYLRWSDAGGCEVRVDVISQIMGPEHCGWESATFVTIGTPIGARHSTPEAPADGARTYIWDPEGVVADIDGTQRDVSVPVEELPGSVADTGFRDGGAELWLDSADPTVLFRVVGRVADRFVLDEPRQILCE